MAQFFKILSVLLLLAVFNPTVSPSSKMFNERRDRAPYIESVEHNSQSLSDTNRIRKPPIHNKELSANRAHTPPESNDEVTSTKETTVDKNIRSVFSTNFGPGLYIFKNTAPLVSKTYINSYNDEMVGDQPIPNPSRPSFSLSSSSKELFKVQRSPDGKLSLVFNEDHVSKAEKDLQNPNSNEENSDNKFETHFPAGLPLKKDKHGTSSSSVVRAHSKKDVIHFPTEEPDEVTENNELGSTDCLVEDEVKNNKSFCSHPRNYPEKTHLEQLIKTKFTNLESFFGEDLVLPQNITQRMNNAPNEEYLCRGRVRTIYPQSGQNKDWDWIYIVNLPEYKQGIIIEECIKPSTPCGENTGLTLPNRFTATCEQHYIYRSLIAYNNDTLYKDTFRIPSCCKCVLRSK